MESPDLATLIFILFAIIILIKDDKKESNTEKADIDENPNDANEQMEKFIKQIEAKWSKYFEDNIAPSLHDGHVIDITIKHIQKRYIPVNKIEVGYVMHKDETIIASSCLDIGPTIQEIKVPDIDVFPVLCDSIFGDSGWTVVLRRQDGSVDFNRDWTEYCGGFGNLLGEFFIGLEKLHRMTKWQKHELIIYLMNVDNEMRHARYSEFQIDNEAASYALSVLGAYSGNAGDSLSTHINATFAAPDTNDKCAKAYNSGWWFHNCMHR